MIFNEVLQNKKHACVDASFIMYWSVGLDVVCEGVRFASCVFVHVIFCHHDPIHPESLNGPRYLWSGITDA